MSILQTFLTGNTRIPVAFLQLWLKVQQLAFVNDQLHAAKMINLFRNDENGFERCCAGQIVRQQ